MPIHPEAVVEFVTGGPAAVLQHLAGVEGRDVRGGNARRD